MIHTKINTAKQIIVNAHSQLANIWTETHLKMESSLWRDTLLNTNKYAHMSNYFQGSYTLCVCIVEGEERRAIQEGWNGWRISGMEGLMRILFACQLFRMHFSISSLF